tara:strand:+ start:390 stop:689 length:300 start_codon:yes stop_codon:yes gene_type:complete
MFGKKKEAKLKWVMNAVNKTDKGLLEVKPVGVTTSLETIDEFEKMCIDAMKSQFEGIRKSVKGHDISIGTFVMPWIHIVHDDEMEDDEKWQETKKNLLK